MHNQHSNKDRNKEGDVHKGLPEAAPHANNPYEEDDHPVVDNADPRGEIPRTRDDSEDDKKDPYRDQSK
ncbi:hypothetical protein LU196_05890 [Pantoea sp. Mb-10]|uniref:hypothetical protein n=1 Tax=unclassified Pantoea TaxID=2630326 RepID=UPI001E3CA558|nr:MULTISPECIES: hypothetical protein [unclassified Pantoea]MCE0489585.1 hypothetical protein [Pantoea sp. Mb-10]MCE0502113.1 hypothetical protein [Pantoea sp. Pb-8]